MRSSTILLIFTALFATAMSASAQWDGKKDDSPSHKGDDYRWDGKSYGGDVEESHKKDHGDYNDEKKHDYPSYNKKEHTTLVSVTKTFVEPVKTQEVECKTVAEKKTKNVQCQTYDKKILVTKTKVDVVTKVVTDEKKPTHAPKKEHYNNDYPKKDDKKDYGKKDDKYEEDYNKKVYLHVIDSVWEAEPRGLTLFKHFLLAFRRTETVLGRFAFS
ncbi:hypothetical protein M427DRAFT_38046 [Gonapodya prolifera JEL478]|uniref:Uncharacterized protein n=1 Tax=Gonapodya prolifera (strain JEL478) TaxID=1344416 RepID=A0A138ZZM1_GONPJ|nr:hypothetical protein M427DRAFT_38046 [Gonapodya prolifera JEL478]|eukprot:KXS09941.1 hypothetical protein M427DRAFT_38046 [Gonapodya prolifera JEL478]